MNAWIQGFFKTIAAFLHRTPAKYVPAKAPRSLEEAKAMVRKAVEKFLEASPMDSADSPGLNKLAGDLGAKVVKPGSKFEADQVVAYFELREAATDFAKHCLVTPEGNVLPPTEDTDRRIVRLQTSAIGFATAIREGLKAGVLADACACPPCALFRLSALAYGNCPLGSDPSFVAAAFVSFMQAVKLLIPAGGISAIVIEKKPTVNSSTPFSNN